MALFKSQEEKIKEYNEKTFATMKKYGLDELSDEKDRVTIQRVMGALAGSGLMEIGSLMSGNEAVMMRVNAQYTKALFEQNCIIIRQLERLNRNLENHNRPGDQPERSV